MSRAEALERRTLLSYAYISFAAPGSTAPTGDGALTLGSDSQATVRVYVYGVDPDPGATNPTPTGTIGLYWYTPGARSFGSDADYNGNATLAPLGQGLAYADLTITTLDASDFPRDAAGDLQLIGFYSGDENFRQDQSYPVQGPVDYPSIGPPVPDNEAFIGVTITATDSLSVTKQPVDAAAGGTIDSVTVSEVNSSGAVDTTAVGQVTVRLSPGITGTGTLGGTTTVDLSNGVATFGGLSIDKAGQYKLTFTDTAGLTATSGLFEVTDGQLVFTTQPAGGPANKPLKPVVTVSLEHGDNSVITDNSTSVVTLNLFGTNSSKPDHRQHRHAG